MGLKLYTIPCGLSRAVGGIEAKRRNTGIVFLVLYEDVYHVRAVRWYVSIAIPYRGVRSSFHIKHGMTRPPTIP